jgi:hypothetical protein
MPIIPLILVFAICVLTVILSGSQNQINKEEEGGEINHIKFCIIVKKEAMFIDGVEII